MKTAERWMTVQHECPFCSCVQEDDSEPNQEWTCINCGETYLLGDC